MSVRAANGTAYATMPNLVKMLAFDANGEGEIMRSSDRKPALRIPIIVGFSAAHSGRQTVSVQPASTIKGRPLPVCGFPQ